MELQRATFDRLRGVIHRLCGLVVTDEKEYLVRDRLEPIIRRHGWSSFEQLADRLGSSALSPLADEVVEAIVTHETSFFRDPHVWEALRRAVLPGLLSRRAANGSRARFWSAAASTGQEAYSLAMLLQECCDLDSARGATSDMGSILATDICASSVRAGSAGRFESRELDRGVSAARRLRYFEPADDGWRVREPLRRLIDFQRLNLAEPLPRWGAFDLICCRNVLIYFDEPTRRDICEGFHKLLAPGGWLLLGAAENLYGISDRFASVSVEGALVYRRL